MKIWEFFLNEKESFLEKDLFGKVDISIFIIILCIIIFFWLKRYVWWKIGFFIADKKYKEGKCSKTRDIGCGCGWGDPHRHRNKLASYGPIILSRKFVRKKICNKF